MARENNKELKKQFAATIKTINSCTKSKERSAERRFFDVAKVHGYNDFNAIKAFFEYISSVIKGVTPNNRTQVMEEIIGYPEYIKVLMDNIAEEPFCTAMPIVVPCLEVNGNTAKIEEIFEELMKKEKNKSALEAFICSSEMAAKLYFERTEKLPESTLLSGVEKKYSKENLQIVLRECIKVFTSETMVTEVELRMYRNTSFSNKVCKWLPAEECEQIIGRKYKQLLPIITSLSAEMQKVVLKCFAKEKIYDVLEHENSKRVGMYILGRVFRGDTRIGDLFEVIRNYNTTIDWVDVEDVLSTAYTHLRFIADEKVIDKISTCKDRCWSIMRSGKRISYTYREKSEASLENFLDRKESQRVGWEY